MKKKFLIVFFVGLLFLNLFINTVIAKDESAKDMAEVVREAIREENKKMETAISNMEANNKNTMDNFINKYESNNKLRLLGEASIIILALTVIEFIKFKVGRKKKQLKKIEKEDDGKE